MVVLKFGGTSVADADAVARLVAIVRNEDRARVVVVSALAGVTDGLIEIARFAAEGQRAAADTRVTALARRHLALARIVRDDARHARLAAAIRKRFFDLRTLVGAAALVHHVSPALLDAIMAHGELLSSRIVADALDDGGVAAAWVDARSVMVTADHPGSAEPDVTATAERLLSTVSPELGRGRTVVLGGFVGATPGGLTTTLGRGGSDYSASIIGACLDAEEIQIWTDVDGMLTADPRVLRAPHLVPRLSFDEATELAQLGAKVLHPATIAPAVARDIPVRILNSRRPLAPGTVITRAAATERPAAAVASLPGISLVDVRARTVSKTSTFLARVFAIFERLGIEPHIVTCSEGRVSAAVRTGPEGTELVSALDPFAEVTVIGDMALVCVVGEQLARDDAKVASVIDALRDVPIKLVSRPASGCHLALAVPARLMATAVARLHEKLFPVEQDGEFRLDRSESSSAKMRARGWEAWLSLEEPGDRGAVVD